MEKFKEVKDNFISMIEDHYKEGLIKVANLINGYMRTPKIEALQRLIAWLNTRAGSNISLLPLDTSDLGSNSWLAGMSDSDVFSGVFIRSQW
jgi:hypothetical protein